ncbi:MAG TPA: hypothetical protein P5254_18065 [Aquihabitans sp.]|nr:hypothetical protein [Aquihabitans sp.]
MNEPSGVRLWVPVTAGIVLWMVHLTASSALANWSCRYGLGWVDHLLTATTAGATVLAMVACERFRRRGVRHRDDRGEGGDGAGAAVELARNLEFLGWFGLILGGFSLLLILYEGSWALTVPACHP